MRKSERVIQVLLLDGSPSGLRTLHDPNEIVRGTFFPRAAIKDFLKRKESNSAGVYILFGCDEGNQPQIYIGQGQVGSRLKKHHGKGGKDFWDEAAVFTSMTESISATQVRYLERKLMVEVKKTKRVQFENQNTPNELSIPETTRVESDRFFSGVRILLEVSGKEILKSWDAGISIEHGISDEVFEAKVKKAEARMIRGRSGYVVLKGSSASLEPTDSASQWIRELRDKHLEAGVLKKDEEAGVLVFMIDSEFNSPSAAAVTITGGHKNGREFWKLPDGRTLKDVEEEESG